MTDVNALINDVVAKAAEYEARMKDEAKTIFAAVTESLKAHPQIALTWVQYTPYFNDGEPCEFSVGDIWVVPATCEERGYGAEEEAFNGYAKEDIEDPQLAESVKFGTELASALSRLPDDIFLNAFDDHTTIFLTGEGAEVEEYSHD